MSVQEIIAGGGGLLLVLITLVQIAPIKVNPWSAIAGAIGRAVNKEVLKELDTVKKKLEEHVGYGRPTGRRRTPNPNTPF